MRKPAEFEAHPTPFLLAQALGMYRAVGKQIHDGDTFTAMLDLGFFVYAFADIRILGVDAYEIVGVERAKGLAARSFAVDWLLNKPLLLKTQLTSGGIESKSFDRYLADGYVDPTPLGNGALFAPMIVVAGHGVFA